jgi:TIR domain/Pentapeptide repeats (8 copies)
MAIQEQLDKLHQGVNAWVIWRIQQPGMYVDLSRADLSRADLSRADLSRADLSGADLSGADLSGADLSGAILRRAILSGADLRRANLREANLSGANLSGANLSGANLSRAFLRETFLGRANLSGADLSIANFNGTNLREANLSGTTMFQTTFNDLDLRPVKGLETIQHLGPSGITTSTLERSEGNIPDLFLKGAGLSDTFITYARSLVQSPIQYYICVLSYSNKDELFAKRLHNDLQQEGVRCWFAAEDMHIGDKIKYGIDEALRLYDKLVLILSEHSLQSDWVVDEVEKALSRETQSIPNVLYPVRVDQAILTCTESWTQKIKETRQIGNFEHWNEPEQYQESFKQLLRALNARKE